MQMPVLHCRVHYLQVIEDCAQVVEGALDGTLHHQVEGAISKAQGPFSKVLQPDPELTRASHSE
jgi:hypothetical protein